MTKPWHDWKHDVLPSTAQRLLRDAATVGAPESVARRQAIEAAIKRVHNLFPEYFRSLTSIDFDIPVFTKQRS